MHKFDFLQTLNFLKCNFFTLPKEGGILLIYLVIDK